MPYNQFYYNTPYQPTVSAPMDRLQQLQAPYQIPQIAAQPATVPPMAAQPTGNGILWVQGEAAAKAYLVTPGTSVLLMDSDESAFYIKTVDTSGMPQPLRTFKYTEVGSDTPDTPRQAETNLDDKYVPRQEYEDLKADYTSILDRLNAVEKKLTRAKGGGTDA